jgi:SAM-dependent methyltransferase
MRSPVGGSTYAATDGAAYEVFLGRWTRRLAEPVLDFAEFPATGRLLEVGCGTGALACAMAERWPNRTVVGVDIAAAYVAFARSCARQTNLAFAVADAVKVPFADAGYAGAAAMLVLNFIPDPAAALREMMRVTARNGRLVAAVWDFRGGLTYQRIFWDTAAGIDPGAAVARDTLFSGALALPDGLVHLFKSVGLARVERTSITIRMEYAHFADYWEPLRGGQGPVGTYVASLAPDVRARVEEAVATAYRSGSPDGPRSMTATAWAVRGEVVVDADRGRIPPSGV